MCCCGKPTINGEEGYSWDGNSFSVRPPDPPELQENDVLIYDEPGRCGRLDSHSHHFRVVKQYGAYYLLVRHGGGDERHKLRDTGVSYLESLDSNGRYWILQMLHGALKEACKAEHGKVTLRWQNAAAEKRIRTRKIRGSDSYKVWIEE